MKAEYTREGWRDFSQRYSGTFGWYEGKEGPVLVRLESVDESSLYFKDVSGMGYTAHPSRGNVFSFLPVIKGSYLYDGDVVVVERRPARQWKRGICIENTLIRNLKGNEYEVGFPILQKLFSGEEDRSVLKFKNDGTLPMLLSNQFSVGKDYGIYLYNTLIGEVDLDNKKVKLEENLFQQEIEDLVTKHSLGWAVTC